jgi:polysaccharide export outer membrane protein
LLGSARVLTRAACLALVLGATSGCGSAGKFTWYTDLPRSEWGWPRGEYVIGIGDSINIRVYEQEGLSVSGRIRRDGRIALPLVGEVMIAGKHPSEVAHDLEVALKPFIVTPRVTVNVEQVQPILVSTLGEINHVGALTLDPPAGLVQAISQAGGPTEFASKSHIFVLRQFPSFQRIRFTYDAIVNNEAGAATFPLRTGDVIVID